MVDDDTWVKREKVWADALAEEILARKAAEAALREFQEGRLQLLVHPQVQMLGDELNKAHQVLDTLKIPRGHPIEGDPDICASMTLVDRVLFLASTIVNWPKA